MSLKSPKHVLILLLCLALAGGAVFYLSRTGEGVPVIRPQHGPAVQAVYATGTVEPTVMLPLASRTTARLTALLADEGDEVEKGQILARLEDEDLQKTLAELQARAELAEKNYERKQELVARKIVSQEVADQALAERDAAQAAVERAQAQVDFLTLTAPEAGRVIRRDGEIGELITAGEAVFWLSCCDGLRVEAEVDEEDIALVKPGQKVVIRADAFPDRVFSGTVDSITPKGDPVSRSYRVRIAIAPDTPLMIGMTAETNIVIREEQDALLIPAGALNEANGVFVVNDGIVETAEIRIGAKTPEIVEVRAGLDDTDLVVRDGSLDLKAGQGVETALTAWEAP